MTSLRVVATSGSALPHGLATAFQDEYGDVLYNLYGSTEASWVCIATPHDLRRHPGTAGTPPLGTVVRLLDDEGRDVPAGATGGGTGAPTGGRGVTGGTIADGRVESSCGTGAVSSVTGSVRAGAASWAASRARVEAWAASAADCGAAAKGPVGGAALPASATAAYPAGPAALVRTA